MTWIHTLSESTRLVVGHDTDLGIDWVLDGGSIAVQDISGMSTLNYKHSNLVTDDEHLEKLKTILSIHGGYWGSGSDKMEEAIAKHLKRAGLYYTFKTLYAYSQGTDRRVVLYGQDSFIEKSDFQDLEAWYAGEVYWVRLEQRLPMCECGCLSDWETVDSSGGVFLDNPEHSDSVLEIANAYFDIQAVTA